MIDKKIAIIIMICLIGSLAIGIIDLGTFTEVDATKKINKKIDAKTKILKTTKNTKIVRINGKNQTLKKYSIPGEHGAKFAYINEDYIMITGAYCTCGRHEYKHSDTIIFENKVKFVKNKKEIPSKPKYSICLNPKKISDKEFTVYNKGGKYHSVDLCMYCGKEKSQVGKSVNQFYMEKIAII